MALLHYCLVFLLGVDLHEVSGDISGCFSENMVIFGVAGRDSVFKREKWGCVGWGVTINGELPLKEVLECC